MAVQEDLLLIMQLVCSNTHLSVLALHVYGVFTCLATCREGCHSNLEGEFQGEYPLCKINFGLGGGGGGG